MSQESPVPPKKSRSAASRPVSLGVISKECGLSRTAVSYALRDHPGIPLETRDRVKTVARRLGYVPDARMAMQMESVRSTKKRQPIPIAWLNMDKSRTIWDEKLYLRPYIEGARLRCAEMGYRLDEFWLREPGMTMRRMSEILFHRGIQGIIIAPSGFYSAGHIRLQWKNFAAVSFDKGILAPSLHRIIPDYFYNIVLTLKILRRAGYKRIGVFLHLRTDRRSAHTYSGGVLHFHSMIPEKERITPFFDLMMDGFQTRFNDWFLASKPDVLVCHHSEAVAWVKSLGHRVPEEVGVVHLGIEDDVSEWAGILQRKREIGAAAAELVISQVQNYRFGLPDPSLDTVIQGHWHHGSTLLIPKPKASSGASRRRSRK